MTVRDVAGSENKPSRQPALYEGEGRGFLARLGPGLITGASDDDPSGIGTYSQAGAQYGYGLLWTMVLSLPLMIAIQEISARIGRISGRGIAGNIRRHYPGWVLYPVVLLLVLMCHNPKIMGRFTRIGKPLRAAGWLATAVMAAAAIGMFATWS